jgi:DNA-binding NarL/FixJ family response regulator
MEPIKVLIADDHVVVREGLIRILKSHNDIEVVGIAEDGLEEVDQAKALNPDVLLLDLAMPNINGLEALDMVKKTLPDLTVVVLSLYDNDSYVDRVLASGAIGYLLKASDPSEISQAIRHARRGEYFFSAQISRKVITTYVKHFPTSPEIEHRYQRHSNQEKKVFLLIVEGKPTKEIADRLFISPRTVEKHRIAICRKIGIKSTVELTHYAIQNGLLNLDFIQHPNRVETPAES